MTVVVVCPAQYIYAYAILCPTSRPAVFLRAFGVHHAPGRLLMCTALICNTACSALRVQPGVCCSQVKLFIDLRCSNQPVHHQRERLSFMHTQSCKPQCDGFHCCRLTTKWPQTAKLLHVLLTDVAPHHVALLPCKLLSMYATPPSYMQTHVSGCITAALIHDKKYTFLVQQG